MVFESRSEEDHPVVSVVSGTINRLSLLKRMVGSVRDSVGDLPYEIILVDNESTDGTQEWCREQEDIVFIQHGPPTGSISAFTLGFDAARGDYVVIMNDDIIIHGDTICRAYDYLQSHPRVGQVAFHHDYQNRGAAQRGSPIVQGMYGYIYGQCCMTPRWLGDLVGWWQDEGEMTHYGGDTRLALRIWELGYEVHPVDGCSVIDYEVVDDTRKKFSHEPREKSGGVHPDLIKFRHVWRNRMPDRDEWIAAPVNNVLDKAARGTLRTLQLKAMMHSSHKMRRGLINEFAKFGPVHIVNKARIVDSVGRIGYNEAVKEIVRDFEPDLVMLQSQREHNSLYPYTVREMQQNHPDTFFFNWDCDTHYPLTKYHFDIAHACHAQFVVTPSIIPRYDDAGVNNVGWWPVGIEQEYIEQGRLVPNGPDVVFMGARYGEGMFPEAETRRDAVIKLSESDLNLALYGNGWNHVGLKARYTGEQHAENARIYARSKMALSISQTADHWGYTSDRLYNICATGCPALVHRFNGMEEHGYVDGKTCIVWSTFDEMIDKAKHYLEHDNERERIGQAGMKVTLKRHTWRSRVASLFCMLEEMLC